LIIDENEEIDDSEIEEEMIDDILA